MKKVLSIILCLSMLMSLVPMSVFAAPDKVPGAQTAEETITADDNANGKLLDGDFTVTYYPGTADTVTNMPENVTASGEYTVDNITIPKREGHYFVGWSLQPGDEAVEKVVLASNINLFAKWVVAGLVFDFDSESEEKLTFSNNTVEYDYANSIVTVNPTTNDPIISYAKGTDALFSGGDYKQVRVRIKPKIAHNAGYTVRFTSKDGNGTAVVPSMGYNGDVYKAYTWKVLPETEFSTLKFDFSSMPEWSANYITGIRFDLPDGVEGRSCQDFASAIDSIAVTGAESLEYFNFMATLPEAAANVEDYGVDAVTTASTQYKVKDVEWIGDFTDGKYFKGNTSYKVKATIVPNDDYVISSHPAMATVNRQLANITVDTELNRAYVEYEFAATESLDTFAMQVETEGGVPAAITVPGEEGGVLQLNAVIGNATAAEQGVYWSIDEAQSKFATVDENGLVTANLDCTALIVTATSKYNPEIKANISISITNQVPEKKIVFHKGVGSSETVSNLPQDDASKGMYTLPASDPTRTNYAFKGWSKEVGGEILTTYDVTEDTTFYANWGYSKGEEFASANGTFVADAATVANSTVANGVLTVVPNNANKQTGIALNTFTGNATASTAIFSGKLDSGLYDYIEVKTTLAPEETEVTVGIQSMNEMSAVTPANTTEKVTFHSNNNAIAANPEYSIFDRVLPTKDGEFYIYRFPVSLLKNWKNTISHVSFNFAKRDVDAANGGYLNFDADEVIEFEYIRFVGRDLPAIDFINFSIPETKGVATTLETLEAAQLGQFNITSFKWTGALVENTYFDGNIAYKIEIKIKENSEFAPLPKSLFRVSINGTALPSSEVKYNTLQKMYTITHTFPKTEDLGDLSLVTLKFVELGKETTKKVFADDAFDVNTIAAEIPAGYRFKGWSFTENGDLITEIVYPAVDTTFYAVYEYIDEIDFSNEEHKDVSLSAENATGAFAEDGPWYVVNPNSNTASATLYLDNLDISTVDYNYVEVIYNGDYEENGFDNRFNEAFEPVIAFYSESFDGNVDMYVPVLSKVEPVIFGNTLCYKYTYDLTKGKTASGDNVDDFEIGISFGRIAFAPYVGLPAWAIGKIKFIKNTDIDTQLVLSDIATPVTWARPDRVATANDKYEIVSVEWDSEDGFNGNGSFKAETVYTATVTVKAKTGYRIVKDTALIVVDGEEKTPDSVVLNDNGTLTVKYTYKQTEALVPFEFSIEGGAITENEGTFQLVPVFTSDVEVPVKTVTYEFIENGPNGKSATITKDGLVAGIYNGNVKIKASPDYNPDAYVEVVVSITNQIEAYHVTFVANTNDTTLANMPGDVDIKRDYKLPEQIPTREGFTFGGWVKELGSTDFVIEDFITEDTTYYATWFAGLNFEFNSPEERHFNYSGYTVAINYNEGVAEFEATSNDPIMSFAGSATNPLFFGGDYTHVQVRMKPEISKNTGYTVRYTSVDANGNPVVYQYSDVADEKRNMWKTLSSDNFTVLDFDFSTISKWTDNYIKEFRLDIPDGVGSGEVKGFVSYIDYVRVINEEWLEFDVTGIDTPVAKAEADRDGVSCDETKYKVTKVEWEEPLLYDFYYDGNIEYTAKIYVKGISGYTASNAPTKMTVNGVETTDFEYDYATEQLIIKYKFPATGDAGDTSANKVTFIGKNPDGTEAEPVERMIFTGHSYNTIRQVPATCPDGTRFTGWATTPDAKKGTVGVITPVEDMALYAAYEEFKEFDFSNSYHKAGVTAKDGTLSFAGNHAIVTALSGESDSKLVTPVLNLNAQDIAYIEVYYSADYTSVNDFVEYSNRFGLTTRPTVLFSKSDDFEKAGTEIMYPVDAQRVILDGTAPYFKYTYDTSEIDSWYGTVGKIFFDPYVNYDYSKIEAFPDWAVRLIRFVPANAIEARAEISIEPPVSKHTPVVNPEDVVINKDYKVTKVEWSPAGNVFESGVPYTVNVTYKYVSGRKFGNETATINGLEATVNDDGEGNFVASYTFPATQTLIPVNVSISGDNEIKATGRFIQLKAKVEAQDGESYIPIKDVVWSVYNADGTSVTYAKITENGRVYPAINKDVDVIVRATSVYDDTKYAEHTVSIMGQNLCKVTFDKNTFADVTDMPEPVYVYDAYVPNDVSTPKREGFFFLGWSVDEDAMEPEESFVIKKDITLYAKWGKGYQWSFDDEATSLNKYSASVNVDYVDGVAYYNCNGKAQMIQDATLLSLMLESKKYNILETRFTTTATTNIGIYVQSATADDSAKSAWNEAAKINKEGFTPDNGAFQIYNVDFSDFAAWNEYPYVRQIRYDVRAAQTGSIGVDYVRLLTPERFVRFHGNGGLIPLYDGEVYTFKEYVELGNITLPDDPVREGYTFLGWAKDPVNYNKLYNGKFVVTDDVHLYAIWTPDVGTDKVTASGAVTEGADGEIIIESDVAQTVVLKCADALEVGKNKTLVIATDYAFSPDSIKLSFIDETGNPVVVSVATINTAAYKKGYVVVDLASVEEFVGTLTGVEVLFEAQAGTTFDVASVYFTTAEEASKLGKDKAPAYVEVTTQQTIETPKAPAPTFPTIPGNGEISSGKSSTTVTPADKPKPTPPKADTPAVTPAEPEKPAETFPETAEFKENQFADVKSADWFYKDVEKTFKLGLMTGKSDTEFVPAGTLTIAEAVTVAARLNATYYKKTIAAAASGEQWYTPYVKYATDNKIIKADQFANYTDAATRATVAQLFVNALPGAWYAPINFFTSVADVKSDNPANKAILMLYNAGIVTGSDDAYSFNPDSNIKRCELSAIINRAVDKESRVRVVLDKAYEDKVITVDAETLISTSIGGCNEKKLAIKDGFATATGKGDPIVYLTNYVKGMKAEDIAKIEIGMKINPENKGKYGATVYFTTDGASISESLSLKTTYKNVSEDGYVTLTLDGTSKKEWVGTIDMLRFDPFNASDEFGISYIRFLPKK